MKKWCNDAWNWHLAVWADRLLWPQSFWIGAVGFFTNFFYLHVFVFKKFFYSCMPTYAHWLELCQKCAQENCFWSSLFYLFLAVVPKSKGRKIEMIMKIVLIKMKLFFYVKVHNFSRKYELTGLIRPLDKMAPFKNSKWSLCCCKTQVSLSNHHLDIQGD